MVQVKVLIPSAAVGALIGKGGETMRNLKSESGCRLQMSKNQEVYPGLCLTLHKLLLRWKMNLFSEQASFIARNCYRPPENNSLATYM